MNIPAEVLDMNIKLNEMHMPKNIALDIYEMCRDFDKEKDDLFLQCFEKADFTEFYEKYNLEKPKIKTIQEITEEMNNREAIRIPSFNTPEESDEWLKINRNLEEPKQELETIEEN